MQKRMSFLVAGYLVRIGGEPGELIRDNDEELAKILNDYSNTCKVCSYWGMCTQYGNANCYDGIYEWIKQEYEDDGYDK